LDRIESASERYLELLENSREESNQAAILDGLHFIEIEARYQEISDAAENTFNWIFDNPSDQLSSNQKLILPFKDWLKKGHNIFHIAGKPGSGKSTLMKFICSHPNTKSSLHSWAGEKELVIAHFFFWKRGGAMQKSLMGLIRALMFHVIRQSRDIIPEIFPQHWDPAKYDPWGPRPTVRIENDEILRAFRQLVANQDIYHSYRYCFFIDGLDEFDEELQSYTNLINSLWGWVESSKGNLKICV